MGSVNPLDILRGSQDGTAQVDLALADLDAIAAENDKSLVDSQSLQIFQQSGAYLSLANTQQHTTIVSLLVVFLVWPEGGVYNCPCVGDGCPARVRHQIHQPDRTARLTLGPW